MLIVQLTDLHIKAARKTAYAGKVDTYGALINAVEQINNMQPQPDLVLITGDLGDFGRLAEYQTAREALDQLAMPFYVVPGNHDDRQALREGFSDHHYLNNQMDHLSYVVDDYSLRLIGLDSTVPGQPFGQLDTQRCQWLDKVLSESEKKRTLIFMHHPPVAVGITHMDVQCLQETQHFREILLKHPQVEWVVCGHLHRPVEFVWATKLFLVGSAHNHAVSLDLRVNAPSSFTLEPAMLRVLYFQPDTQMLVSHQMHIAQCDGPHPFFKDGKLID